MSLMTDIFREAIWTALALAAPVLLAILVVALVINIVQTAMQLQDPTLNLVPRLVAAAVTVLALLPWLLDRLTEYSADLYRNVTLGG
ncbi:Flagellar biosynthetic protein FliQ [Maioricimonas rarisocia]|uniref:Flagellar biosynthetic protein FliQ n=1 Tax=Maioricimonas rarisocia TaxID=2528026 RepID=A0A517ZDX6_9PLAN|nr:flagellar biosynthetic protein FliQ [Maioricimonas rarisocia]QDU40692.1 Flagellar biosynthetic protein FliQ [Maioricimonas rarisocia]